ncbi:hypothetical protein FC41_GL000404 [Lactobacillus hominis DSM 23910 = CRBIP 24.179]|uniref:Prepilin-type N-terminal cleavage/methylation domain-containing protein n=2 Tax=Lactobacillus hominis TaxID=1203033 RepID=I7IW98_9LACO|nr:hypothetical protein FC41_GL000404 [Lactobacillus hominis DSM 23910 = CRBIP 24.179]CCI82708.1 Predicted protein [Lactobacillus hominis DSM 23910 = CRBIP 24.179]
MLKKKAKGFTLMEMVIVIAIIAILILLVLPNLTKQKDKAGDRTSDAFRTTLQTQVDLQDDPKSITSFDKLESDSLSKQQLEKANKEYKIVDGQVTKIKKDEK